MKSNLPTLITALSLVAACAPHLQPRKTGKAPVNGIEMYYEIHGAGEGVPLVLLHGGGSTIEVTWSKILPHLRKNRSVIAVEEQGHGRTTGRPGPVRFDTSADDVAALLDYLQIPQADVLGFSNGAEVGLALAIRHPAKVRKFIFASSLTKRSGAQPWFWDFMRKADFSMMPEPLKDAFLKVNPDPAKLKTMHDKDLERMLNFKDFPDKDLKKVRAKTLVLQGDRDIATPEHALEIARLIPAARLMILPGNHGDYLGELVMTQQETRMPELTAGLLEEFLNEP